MSEPRYDIYFQGDLLDGFYLDFVQADMAKLFKADPSKIETLFSGTPQPVKLNVDKPTAAKYKMALEKIGARPIIVPMGDVPEAKAVATQKEAARDIPEGVATESDGISNTGTASKGDWSVLPPGSDIGEQREQPTVAVDTSRLSVAQPGATLVEHPNRPEPVQVDISGLTLDEPGVTLVENPSRPEPVQVDISGLTLDEPGAILVEPDRSAQPPAPDISHLDLE